MEALGSRAGRPIALALGGGTQRGGHPAAIGLQAQGLDLRLRSDPPPADEPARESEVEGPFMAALAGLSEKDREALMLAVWDELAPRQAAAVLGESSATFRARLYRAKRRLRARLEAQGQPEPCRTDRMQAKETTR